MLKKTVQGLEVVELRHYMHKYFILQNNPSKQRKYKVWNFNSGNYLFTTDTK